MSKDSLGHRLLEGVHLNVVGQLGAFALNLAITPLLVRRLGPDGYALYTLMWTLIGWMALLNLGTLFATQKYTAQHWHDPKGSPLGGLVRSAVVFQLAAAVVGGLVLLAGRRWIAHSLLHLDGTLLAAAPRVFGLVAVAAPAYFLLQFALALLQGMQRFRSYNLLQTLQSSAVALCAAGLLLAGFGLTQIAWSFAWAHGLLALLALWKARDALLLPARSDDSARAEFMGYAAKSFPSLLLWMAAFQGDRVFIGAMLPLAQMGYYVICASIAQKFNALCASVASISFPIMTELHATGQHERRARFYLRAQELTFFGILPIAILMFVLVPQFMTLWLGMDFGMASTWPFRLLVLSNLLFLSGYLAITVSMGSGRPEIPSWVNAGRVAVLLASWPLLIPRFGIRGAAAAYLLAEVCVTPAFLGFVHARLLGVTWVRFWRESCWRPAVSGLLMAAVVSAIRVSVGSWLGLIGAAAAGGAVFLIAGYGLIDKDAKAVLAGWLRAKLG